MLIHVLACRLTLVNHLFFCNSDQCPFEENKSVVICVSAFSMGLCSLPWLPQQKSTSRGSEVGMAVTWLRSQLPRVKRKQKKYNLRRNTSWLLGKSIFLRRTTTWMTMNLQETFKFNSFSCTFQQTLTQYKHQQQFIYMSRVGKKCFWKILTTVGRCKRWHAQS